MRVWYTEQGVIRVLEFVVGGLIFLAIWVVLTTQTMQTTCTDGWPIVCRNELQNAIANARAKTGQWPKDRPALQPYLPESLAKKSFTITLEPPTPLYEVRYKVTTPVKVIQISFAKR